MIINKTRLISCCKKHGIDTTGKAKELADKLNDYFGANYFNYSKKYTSVEISIMHWNRLEKDEMAHKKQASMELRTCLYCNSELPAKAFKSLNGMIKKHCLACRNLLREK